MLFCHVHPRLILARADDVYAAGAVCNRETLKTAAEKFNPALHK